MVQDIRTGKNTTAAAGTDTNGDQWLDVLPDPLTSDSLKAKNWQTNARRVDDNSYYGNLHLGLESKQPDLRTEDAEIASAQAEDSQPVVSKEFVGIHNLSEEPETSTDTTPQNTGTKQREEQRLFDGEAILPSDAEAFSSLQTPLIQENEAPRPEGSLSDPSATAIDSDTVVLTSKEIPLPPPSPPPADKPPEEVVPEESELPPIAATISGSGENLREDLMVNATGRLSIADPNPGESAFRAGELFGTYGRFHLSEDGNWSYALNHEAVNIQALGEGESVIDTFTVYSVDGTSHTLFMTITGTNDIPVIAGDTAGKVIEDEELSTSGRLTIEDVDAGESSFREGVHEGSFGSLKIDQEGNWAYSLDPKNEQIQALAQGEQTEDTVTVFSADGTEQRITVTITGTNDGPEIAGDTAGKVIEDKELSTGGRLTIEDVDAGQAAFQAGVHEGSFGTLKIDSEGNWAYNLDPKNEQIQALGAGEQTEETITVTSLDGTKQKITITITGTNDAAQITGTTLGAVQEDVTTAVSGTLAVTDVDSGEAHFTAATHDGTYGSLAIDEQGAWTYTLNNQADNVQALGAGKTATDTITVTAADGTEQQITLSITGTNDAPVIAGDTAGKVIEDEELSTGGRLTITDVDAGEASFREGVHEGSFGTLKIDQEGNWAYSLDPKNEKIQSLGEGEQTEDTITVFSADGTAQRITVTITGTNDGPEIAGETAGKVIEDKELSTGGRLTIEDVDAGQAAFQAGVHEGSFGTLKIDAEGNWAYSLDPKNEQIQALSQDEQTEDTITVTSLDGTEQKITVTITGTNDGPEIAGETAGKVIEDEELSTGGRLTIEDVDAGESSFREGISEGNFGTLKIDSEGNWAYNLDPKNEQIQALAQGEQTEDTITVFSADGTEQKITVTITGNNDAPDLGKVVEESPNQLGGARESTGEGNTQTDDPIQPWPSEETIAAMDAADTPEPDADTARLQIFQTPLESDPFVDPLESIGQVPPSVALEELGDKSTESRGDLEKFVVTGNDPGSIENGNNELAPFVVSDSDPAADEVPAMEGLDATPEESKTTTPEDAGIGAEDATIPEEIQEHTAYHEETVPV